MSAVEQQLQDKAYSALQRFSSALEQEAEQKLPIGLDELAKLGFALIQPEVQKGEEWLAEHAAMFVTSVEDSVEAKMQTLLKEHPALADLWAKIKPKPPETAVIQDDIMQAVLKYTADGTIRAKLGLS